jgi:glutamyl-Q tRNA(Asp) synthetase
MNGVPRLSGGDIAGNSFGTQVDSLDMSSDSSIYRGLHFGSLVAAVGSFLQARVKGGKWLVRIEDIDPPREVAGAADDILRTLERFGLHWDETVTYQSTRTDAYREAIERLRRAGSVYACGCSRREIADSSLRGSEGLVYPGTCREGLAPDRTARALRVRTDGSRIVFDDRWQGRFQSDLERDAGDFVVRRADGFAAYQLAVVVDDAMQGITEVVRGADLLLSTPRQLHLQRLLSFPAPAYAHLPAAVNAAGEKLSKQTGAQSIAEKPVVPLVLDALRFLGQHVSVPADADDVDELWRVAINAWKPEEVPRVRSVSAPW